MRFFASLPLSPPCHRRPCVDAPAACTGSRRWCCYRGLGASELPVAARRCPPLRADPSRRRLRPRWQRRSRTLTRQGPTAPTSPVLASLGVLMGSTRSMVHLVMVSAVGRDPRMAASVIRASEGRHARRGDATGLGSDTRVLWCCGGDRFTGLGSGVGGEEE